MLAEHVVSRFVDLDGPVHVTEFGGEGPQIVCVHGLGGSCANWLGVASVLCRLGRVTAVDLPGFGLTPPAGRRSDLRSSQRVLDGYLRTLDRPATVIANSMGGAVAMLQAAGSPSTMERLVLASSAAPMPAGTRPDPVVAAAFGAYGLPGLAGAAVAARSRLVGSERAARWILELCTARIGRVSPELIRLHVEIAERRRHIPGVDRAFVQAARSVLGFVFARKAYDRLVEAVSVPTLVVHGASDRLVPVEAAHHLGRMRPDWQVRVLEDVGHLPMLEVPATFGELVADWFPSREAA